MSQGGFRWRGGADFGRMPPREGAREATMKTITCGVLLGLALGATMLLAADCFAADNDTRPLSPAQIALFESDHLGSIRRAERLEYRFARETSARSDDIDSFTDRIEIDVRPRTGSSGKDVWTDFLSAEHHMSF